MKTAIETITTCLLGDDRERSYPVTYRGVADFPRWDCEDGTLAGVIHVALIQIDEGRETLIAQHPDYGWCSANNEFCRDFEPQIDDARLNAAS